MSKDKFEQCTETHRLEVLNNDSKFCGCTTVLWNIIKLPHEKDQILPPCKPHVKVPQQHFCAKELTNVGIRAVHYIKHSHVTFSDTRVTCITFISFYYQSSLRSTSCNSAFPHMPHQALGQCVLQQGSNPCWVILD